MLETGDRFTLGHEPMISSTPHYVVATLHPWNLAIYEATVPTLPGQWHLVQSPEQLTKAYLDSIAPRYVFFPHWSHKVPDEIVDAYECVCFHMTDVPYGRGGSPLQNLILRGHSETVMSALRMVQELDAGPVYAKAPLSLHGTAGEIYQRAAALAFRMIGDLVAQEPTPQPQTGEPVQFKRRHPAQSEITADIASLDTLYDHIRMLDAENYPHAFMDYGAFRLAFTSPVRQDGALEAKVTITPRNGASRAEPL